MLPDLPSLDFQPRFYSGGPSRFHLPFLYDLLGERRPRRIVLLGFGDEQIHFTIGQALLDFQFEAKWKTIRRLRAKENAADDQLWQEAIAQSAEFFGDRVSLIEQDPLKAAEDEADGSIDFLVLDDFEDAETLRDELVKWRPKLSKEAVVLAHGVLLERESSPQKAWAEFCQGGRHFAFEAGNGLGVLATDSLGVLPNKLLTQLLDSVEAQNNYRILYRAIAERIDAQDRAVRVARRNATLQLRQVWFDTLLSDRWKAQEIMDHLEGEVSRLQKVVTTGKDDSASRAFAELQQDRMKAQLVMDAQAEQLKHLVGRGEALAAENKNLKAKVAEQKKILNAAKAACRKGGRCLRLIVSNEGEKKKRRSFPEKIARELRRMPANLRRLFPQRPQPVDAAAEEEAVLDRYEQWILDHEPDVNGLRAQRKKAGGLLGQPKFSLLLPIYNTPVRFLDELLDSLGAQTYQSFEICAVDGGSTDAATIAALQKWSAQEPRFLLQALPENLGIAENTNRALAAATGDLLICIDHDDRLPPFALFEMARASAHHPAAELFYSDEDRLSAEGKRHSPFFKPEWNPEYLLSSMYLGHLTAYRRSLVERVGKFRPEFEQSQDYDFALRATEVARGIVHVPHVLYHWREHPASGSAGGKPEARKTNLAALSAAIERRGLDAEVLEYPAANRVRMRVAQWPKVSIIIPTDSAVRGKFLVDEIPKMTSYPDYEVVMVTNSKLAEQLEVIAPAQPAFRFVRYDEPFNFSEKCNRGAHAANGDRLIFFNDDVQSGQPDWIQNLIEPLENPEIGAVAPKLLYENDRIQHAGLVMGVRGLVGTACHEWPANSAEYVNFAQSMRDVAALSGACLAMRRKDFFAVGEWDTVNVPIAHSDLDLSFKVRAAGLRCVYTPFVTMRHRGHASIGALKEEAHKARPSKVSIYLLKRWARYATHDPYFTDQMRDWLFVDSPTPIRMWASDQEYPDASKRNLLFVTHDLTWSGAPLIVFQLAQWCKAQGHFVTVMSPEEGPLQRKFIEAGIPLIVDELVTKNHPSFTEFASEFDCVIASTIFGAPIVRALKPVGVPHIWWIHEGRVARHFLGSDADMRAALGLADLIITPDTHSSQVYQPFTNRAIRVLPYGIPDPGLTDFAAIEPEKEGVTFLLLGTIEERKGQQMFLHALRKLPREILEAARFRIVGRPHDVGIAAEIKAAARELPTLLYHESVPHEEAIALIRNADVAVSCSWDETGPLILMEALAVGTPILSTTVGVVSENLASEDAGLFFSPGNVNALAEAIERLVRDPSLITQMHGKARAAYEKYFTLDRFAEGFMNLVAEVGSEARRPPGAFVAAPPAFR